MKVTRKFHAEELELNMTPMIDIVFQLIIFFVVTTEVASYDRIEGLSLPYASAAREERTLPGRLVISIVAAGTKNRAGKVLYTKDTVIIGGQPRTLTQVEDYLAREKAWYREGAGESKQPVLIQGDQNVEWRLVQDVIEKASKLKFWRLSFSVKRQL